jgi:hypothetical protein
MTKKDYIRLANALKPASKHLLPEDLALVVYPLMNELAADNYAFSRERFIAWLDLPYNLNDYRNPPCL